MLENAETVVTISRSTAVAAVVEGAWERGWGGSVTVLEGTASGHGSDQARRLSAFGRAILRPDAAAPETLNTADVVVVVGADAVGSRRFVNSAGTRDLLEQARLRCVKTVLVADSGKNVEEEVVGEMIHRSPVHHEADGREWPVFEAIPLELITTRITE